MLGGVVASDFGSKLDRGIAVGGGRWGEEVGACLGGVLCNDEGESEMNEAGGEGGALYTGEGQADGRPPHKSSPPSPKASTSSSLSFGSASSATF